MHPSAIKISPLQSKYKLHLIHDFRPEFDPVQIKLFGNLVQSHDLQFHKFSIECLSLKLVERYSTQKEKKRRVQVFST